MEFKTSQNVNMLPNNRLFLHRTYDLSRLGVQYVRSNPTVGSIIVKDDVILSEGYYKKYGGKHAEVHAFENLHKSQLSEADVLNVTLYVSLEPCCIVGKTPACTDLIKQNSVTNVVIGSIDKTPKVDGNGVTILQKAGIKTLTNVEKIKGDHIAKSRNVFAIKQRPYITLKWAESADGLLSSFGEQTFISNEYSKRLVHKWRSENDAILIGTNTALIDNPQLNNRHYFGPSPLRIVLDRTLRLPNSLHIFNDRSPTWIITESNIENVRMKSDSVSYINLDFDQDLLKNLMDLLYKEDIGRLFVEGGSKTLDAFIKDGLVDEFRIIKSDKILKEGIAAPSITLTPNETIQMGNDKVSFYYIS